ncbi:synaptonemal complex central element protein 1 isoform X2 [Pelmatolapia mariae]|uniref:synaptonemal complex central element protein 1 isoform X2 n=1 Tax=Pelmatolapia mariae TaxID=158779 RepID=UPI003211D201
MSDFEGFRIEDMINVKPLRGGKPADVSLHTDKLQNLEPDTVPCTLLSGGQMHEPKVEQLIGKLGRLKQALEKEIVKIKSVSDSLEKELENLQTKVFQLEAIYKEKEEVCNKLQFQCEESEQDAARHLQLNKKSEELLEQYRYEIQDLKLKHRKLRMRFENLLHQLIDQHKNLHYVFTPERLPDELKSVENTKSQLLAAEKLKLTQLHNLDEELEEMKNQKQAQAAAAETQE